jgi:lysophospholipase
MESRHREGVKLSGVEAENNSAVGVREGTRFLPGGAGRIYFRSMEPLGSTWARIGLLHGYGDHCGRYEHFYRWMGERGVASCAFDFRGHGRSEGRRGFVNRWEEFLEDLEVFLSQPEMKASGGSPVFLVAHSHGALVGVMAGLRGMLSGVAGVVLTCPYFKSGVAVPWWKAVAARVGDKCWPGLRVYSGIRAEWLCCDEEMIADSKSDPLGHHIATPRWFSTMQVAQSEVMRRAGEFKMPMLMVIGKKDRIAVAEVGEEFYARAASGEKRILVYPEMLHEVLREKERLLVFEEIVAWMKSLIQRRGAEAQRRDLI